MPIAATDLVVYGSQSMFDDDSGTAAGGAIDLTKRVVFTDIASTGTVEISSSSASDSTQNITIHGRTAAGVLTSEQVNVNGTTWMPTTTQFERITKAVLSGTCVGTITVRTVSGAVTLMTFEPGLLQIRRVFYNASADVAGGSAKTYFDKVFVKNNHSVLSLTEAVISEQADPSGKVTFGLAASLNDTGTNGGGNNRQVAPSGITFDNNAKNVVGGNLPAGDAQGVWLQLSLAAGDAAQKTTWTLRVSGNTV